MAAMKLMDARHKRILIVDDEPAVANLIADIAGILDCEVKILHSGDHVLDVAKNWKPDIITLDVQMPGKSGIECLSELKDHPETCRIPIVIISVVANRPDILRKLSQAERVLEKPLAVKTLTDCISQIIPAVYH